MRLMLIPKLLPAALFFVAAFSASAQANPAGTQPGLTIVVGAGVSDFGIDWGPGTRMEGISAWVDFYPHDLPSVFNGLGAEVEGRDIDFGRPATISTMRQDAIMGGPIYAWNRYRSFRPYGKFLAGVGSVDYPPFAGYSHATSALIASGGGAEYRVWHRVWIRGDYEYQFWHHVFGTTGLNPNGFTIGASYRFGNLQTR